MTDKITADRELMQQLYDELELADFECDLPRPVLDLMGKLREALAAQPAEPVAWYLPSPDGDDSIFRDHRTVVACTGNKWDGFLPLYAAPPAPAAVPPAANISTAPACLNTNDKAMWVNGWNECRDAMIAAGDKS